jgi:hypothetical protein
VCLNDKNIEANQPHSSALLARDLHGGADEDGVIGFSAAQKIAMLCSAPHSPGGCRLGGRGEIGAIDHPSGY